jgi:hypothetical protein
MVEETREALAAAITAAQQLQAVASGNAEEGGGVTAPGMGMETLASALAGIVTSAGAGSGNAGGGSMQGVVSGASAGGGAEASGSSGANGAGGPAPMDVSMIEEEVRGRVSAAKAKMHGYFD